MESRATVLLRLAALLLLVLLDARDLYFKWQWLGSDDAFRFRSTSVERLPAAAAVIPLTGPFNASAGEPIQRVSGWSSYLHVCGSVDAFQSKYFLHARLHNCTLGGKADVTSADVASQLIVSGGVRADSMAWAACQLLFVHRRPPICHENIVVEFLRRYAMAYPSRIAVSAMFVPMSDAEAEALQLLDVISKSAPLSAVVCVEGFEYTDAKLDTKSTLFGCASPTVFEAAFVGRHATSFADLHRTMAWLTVHDVNLLGMHYVVRQNAISSFSVVSASSDSKTMTLVHESDVNLSSSGVLYHLLIGVDLLLLVAHTLSTFEVASLVALRSERLKRSGGDVGKLSVSFFSVSLYRSTPVIVLTVVSQVVSWILLLPLSVILSWSESPASQLHALLTIVRVWVLVLLSLRVIWHCIVVLSEASAYQTLKHTFISPFEVIGATILALLVLRPQLLTVREKKYGLDKQRLVDATTFGGATAVVSNAYHDEQDFFPLASRASVVSLLYMPLLHVLVLSVVVVGVIVVVRFVYFQRRHTTQGLGGRPSSPAAGANGGPYARLPAEDLLATAIRAEQLVRSRLSLETISPNQKWLRAEQYLEHGVVLEDGKFLRTRQGFLGVAKPKIHIDDDHDAVGGRGHLEGRMANDHDHDAMQSDGVAPADSPTKKRRMSAHIPSLR